MDEGRTRGTIIFFLQIIVLIYLFVRIFQLLCIQCIQVTIIVFCNLCVCFFQYFIVFSRCFNFIYEFMFFMCLIHFSCILDTFNVYVLNFLFLFTFIIMYFVSNLVTPVAGLFLTQLGFEKIFKT